MNESDLITESMFATRMDELKTLLLFKRDAFDAILQDHRDWAADPNITEQRLSHVRSRAIDDAMSMLSVIASRMNKFPERHRNNMVKAMTGNHPEWNGKLDGIVTRLGSGSIFILTGTRGTGKTQIATAVARSVCESANRDQRRVLAEYSVLGEVFTEIKGTFKSGADASEDAIVGKLSRVRLLVLDECQEITGTDWQNRIFTLLVDARYRSNLDTILITNATQTDFLASAGESVADRIAECGYLIECDWPSFRRATP
jgi:Cdc6-like AAA superfamily ATPase